ncbi:hypothetical protein J2S22_001878 [Rhodoplanes tepidamans]|nr:hypothetical protein [Rhodoplanes tepidamans]
MLRRKMARGPPATPCRVDKILEVFGAARQP